jgi:hypothetical protein
MFTERRFLFGLLCGVAACNLAAPQIVRPARPPQPSPQVEPPEPPPISDREIGGTWVGTTVCRDTGSERTVELILTITLDYISADSCKTHVCERTAVTGVLQLLAMGDAGTTIQKTVRGQGSLAGRGVSLYRKAGIWGPSVHVLSGEVSLDGSTLSGGADECGDFSLRKRP